MPEFEVHYMEDESKGWPDGFKRLGTHETNRTAEAVERLGDVVGTYRVRAIPEGDDGARLWRLKADGSAELLP